MLFIPEELCRCNPRVKNHLLHMIPEPHTWVVPLTTLCLTAEVLTERHNPEQYPEINRAHHGQASDIGKLRVAVLDN